ncbi:MAG: ATP-dependent DNA ligase [Nitrosopumilus sp.]|nr:ATP-dependent DNA ligase [Nitrosopumilus sp.]
MKFAVLAGAFGRMESTSKRTELTAFLVDLLRETPPESVATITYLIQGKLRPDFEGVELGVAEKLAARAIAKSAGVPASAVADRFKSGGDLGDAAAGVLDSRAQTTFAAEEITVDRVYETLLRIARASGARSQEMKARYISSLLNDATPDEARYIVKLLLGTMRLGVAENTMLDALAISFAGGKEARPELERAYNVSSDLGRVASAAAGGGAEAARGFEIRMYSPVRPMLAERVRDPSGAEPRLGAEFAAEFKLDGERVQIHAGGERVAIFSRRLEDVASYYPDIIEMVPPRIGGREAILEAEAVAVNEETGAFLPFQELMHRRRKHGVAGAVTKYPVSVNLFDVLYVDGRSLLCEPYSARREILEGMVDADQRVRCVQAARTGGAGLDDLMEDAFNAGAEGLMLKKLDSTYQAGSRGSNWLKLKREYRDDLADSLDLVVVGAFFGRGRRTGMYGTLLLATNDAPTGTLTSVCKVGTGFTDADLDSLYQMLSPDARARRDRRVVSGMEADVWFDPSLVIEVAASEVTLSPTHKAGMDAVRKGYGFALRFPKFTGRIRDDKSPEQASTNEELEALYAGQNKAARA